MAADDWSHALMMAGSESRGPVLVEALRATAEPEEKRKLLVDWLNVCEAYAPVRDDLRVQMELAGFFTDDKGGAPPVPPLTVYRGSWEDDEAELALSWTTNKDQAEFFARALFSFRAMFLGTYREGVDAYIWKATCHEMYGYLSGRGEREVLAKRLTDVEPVAALVRERKE